MPSLSHTAHVRRVVRFGASYDRQHRGDARDGVSATYEGWKGGEYRLKLDTSIHLDGDEQMIAGSNSHVPASR